MKQTITPEQLDELSEGGLYKLRDWLESINIIEGLPADRKPLLSIGQMIEFLDGHGAQAQFKLGIAIAKWSERDEPELCDALWEAVKEVLEHD